MYTDILTALKQHKGIYSKSTAKKAQKAILDNEKILFAVSCNIAISPLSSAKLKVDFMKIKGKINGIFIITNQRIMFFKNSLGFALNDSFKQISLAQINSVDYQTILGTSKVRICGITDMFVIDTSCANELICTLENARAAVPQGYQSIPIQNNIDYGAASSSPSSISVADELQKLYDLRQKGILTEAEYQNQKSKLLR